MAVKIHDVTVSKDHQTLPQPITVNVGETIVVTVLAEEVTWGTIKNCFQTWNDVKKLSNWNSVKNYT